MTTTETTYGSVFVMNAEAPYEPPPRARNGGHRSGLIRRSSNSRRWSIDDREHGVWIRAGANRGVRTAGPADDAPSPELPVGTITSPRHRHNFDQIRYMPQGGWYGQRKYEPGTLGYFPEGVYYGPTRRPPLREPVPHAGIVLQFAGPSRAEGITFEQVAELNNELDELGVKFVNGIAVWPDGRKQDGFEALWEHYESRRTGGRVVYPPARYGDPIFVHPKDVPWMPTEASGVTYKQLGCFNESGPNVSFLHIEAGASTRSGELDAYQFRYVIEGDVTYEDEALQPGSALYYPPQTHYQGLSSLNGGTMLVMQVKADEGVVPPIGLF